MTSIYHVSKHSSFQYGSLIDRGANGGLAGADVHILERTGCTAGSSQVPFLTYTLEIPQKFAAQVLALNLLLSLLLSFSLNYELFLYFCFCFFFHSYGSFNHTNSTSLSFSEFSELFISTLLLSRLRESHFALSSARCHF